MSQERIKILNMLKDGSISSEEADALLGATQPDNSSSESLSTLKKSPPKFLRILVDADDHSKGKAKVNVKIPLAILRTGIKLSSLFPDSARDMDSKFHTEFHRRGLNFNLSKMSSEDIEAFISALQESEIVIDAGQDGRDSAKVRLFCE